MKKILNIILLFLIILTCGCGKKENEVINIENNSKKEIRDVETIDGNIQVNNSIIELPITVKEFKEKTKFNFTELYGNKYNDASVLDKEIVTSFMTSDNTNIITLKIENSEEKLKKIDDCAIIEINISRTNKEEINKEQENLIFAATGIGFNEDFGIYEEKLANLDIDNFIRKENKSTVMNCYKKGKYTLTIFYDKNNRKITEIDLKAK